MRLLRQRVAIHRRLRSAATRIIAHSVADHAILSVPLRLQRAGSCVLKPKSILLLVVLGIAGAYAIWTCARLRGSMETMGPKHGRIIDRDSGAGVAGVSIVAEGYFSAAGPWESVHHCTFVQMTKTDDEGYYHFPGAYSRWFATGNANLTWSMYVSKEGYAPADLPWPLQYREDDRKPVGNSYWRSNGDAFRMDG